MPKSGFHFGRCHACSYGCLFAMKSTMQCQLYLLCDVCETRWRSPEETGLPGATSLYGPHDEPASDAEIRAAGWTSYALRVSDDE